MEQTDSGRTTSVLFSTRVVSARRITLVDHSKDQIVIFFIFYILSSAVNCLRFVSLTKHMTAQVTPLACQLRNLLLQTITIKPKMRLLNDYYRPKDYIMMQYSRLSYKYFHK